LAIALVQSGLRSMAGIAGAPLQGPDR